MNFTSFSFWWLFFGMMVPIILVRLISLKLKIWKPAFDKIALAILSLSLFFSAAHDSFIIFVIELIINYIGVDIIRGQQPKKARATAAVIIVINIGLLIFYKYLGFFLTSIATVFSYTLSSELGLLKERTIPPGISFYTFQMVGFVVDSLNHHKSQKIGFIDYINFTSFFPQIVAGPIERRKNLLPQIQNFTFRWNAKNFDVGMRWVALGMFMKLVLADNLAIHIRIAEFSNVWLVWLFTLLFSFRIYFDFAGYSFVALGLAKIFGIELSFNFSAPYLSHSIQEFWRRWHITLSEWFRDYLFIPLGGSRNGRTSINVLIVFLVSGLWHGAGWNFVLWGGYHGILLAIHRQFGKYSLRLSKFNWLITFISITVGWLLFMETDLNRLISKLFLIVSPNSYSIKALSTSIGLVDDKAGLLFTLSLSVLVLALEYLASKLNPKTPYRYLSSPFCGLMLIGLTILFAARTASQFVYFAF